MQKRKMPSLRQDHNSSYVSIHVRRTHPEIGRAADPARFEQKIVEQIVNLFNQLSPETRKQVLRTLLPQ